MINIYCDLCKKDLNSLITKRIFIRYLPLGKNSLSHISIKEFCENCFIIQIDLLTKSKLL